MYVKVEYHENVHIAYCPTLGVSTHGEDYDSALDALKRSIAETYNDYMSRYPNLTQSNLDVLRVCCSLMGEDLPATRDMIAEMLREELKRQAV